MSKQVKAPPHHSTPKNEQKTLEHVLAMLYWIADTLHGHVLPDIENIKTGMIKMDDDIKTAIDEVAELTGVVQANNAAWKIMTDLNQAQADKIKQLEDQLAQGTDVTAEDLTALRVANTDARTAIDALKSNLPAGTGVPDAPEPVSVNE